MPEPIIREFRLAGRDGDGIHPFIDDHGVWHGDGTALLEQDDSGTWHPRPQPILEKLLSEGYGRPVTMTRRMANLATVARALNKGDRALAAICLVHAELPPLPGPSGASRMARLDKLLKNNPDQPRVPAGNPDGGEWTDSGVGVAAGTIHPSSEAQVAKQKADDAKYPPKIMTLSDGSTIRDPYTHGQMQMPQDVSLQQNAELGEQLVQLPPAIRDLRMVELFRPGGDMDYQSAYSSDDKYNRAYMSFGNFNYGVVAAAAGFLLDEAKFYAAVANHFGSGDNSGQYGGNPTNAALIEQGYNAYKSGNIPKDK